MLCVAKLRKSNLLTSVSHHDLSTLKMALRQFAAERDWDQFHSSKKVDDAIGTTNYLFEQQSDQRFEHQGALYRSR